jgi:hypothetical protein
MDVAIVAFIGALIGAYNAKKRGGNRKDIAQYATVFAIIFALAGLILSLVVTRVMGIT